MRGFIKSDNHTDSGQKGGRVDWNWPEGGCPKKNEYESWTGLFLQDRELPMIALRLIIASGSADDPPGLEGLAYLTGQLLIEGTRKKDAKQISEAADAMGGALYVDSSRDYTLMGMNVLSEDLDAGLELLMELLQEPVFPEEEFVKKREKIKGQIASQEDRPGGLANRAFLKALFGKGGYGHSSRGLVRALDAMTLEDVRNDYEKRFRSMRVVLTLVGDLDASETMKKAESLLAGWSAGRNSKEAKKEIDKEDFPAPSDVVIHRDIPQATAILGQPCIPRSHPDVYPMMVMNYILGGGGFDSRVLEEIRSKRGLAYSASSGFDPGLHGGLYRVGFQTKNETMEEASVLAKSIARGMQKAPVSEAELEGAKKFMLGSFPMRLDSNSGIASHLALWECYGLGTDYPSRVHED